MISPRAHIAGWRRGSQGRKPRVVLLAIVVGLIVFQLIRAGIWIVHSDEVLLLINWADHHIYMEAAARIRAGGPVYPAWQLAGPYDLDQRPELYPPPTVLLLIVPMSYLPDVVWWLLPLAILVGTVIAYRPSLLACAGILICLSIPFTWGAIAVGNPVLYAAAAVAISTRWRWVSVAAFLKPSVYPFGLIGIRSGSWWIALTVLAALSVSMLPMWADYVTAMRNLRDWEIWYSATNVPLLLIPLIAWAGRRRVPAREPWST
jgi:hypothetical protein